QLGEHRQRQHFATRLFAYREIAGRIAEIAIGGLQVDGNRIVHAGLYTGFGEPVTPAVALRETDDVEVIHMPHIAAFAQHVHGRLGKASAILGGIAPARLGPRFEMTELYTEDGALHAVHAVVEAAILVFVADFLAPRPQ